MAIVTTDDKHYKSIANAIREYEMLGIGYTPENMAAGVRGACHAAKGSGYSLGLAEGERNGYDNGFMQGKDEGKDLGREEAKAECESKHYSAIVVGDGTSVLKIPDVPFKPDFLSICTLDNDIRLAERQMSTVVLNFRPLDQIFGFTYFTTGPKSGTTDLGYFSGGMLATIQMDVKASFEADGSVVLKDFVTGDKLPLFFAAGAGYLVQASKVIEKSDKERITDVINRLPDGGAYTITFPKAVKEVAFTSEEWAALIATKPTYTITLF